MYKVRFHLARGKHYQHWQVKDKDGNNEYYDPAEVTLIMKDCNLHNQPNASKKIFYQAENKRPCAWIKCKTIEVISTEKLPFSEYELAYNPRKSFCWRVINHTYLEPLVLGYNMDFKNFSYIASHDKQLYCFQTEFFEQVNDEGMGN